MKVRHVNQLDLNYQEFKPITALEQEAAATAEELNLFFSGMDLFLKSDQPLSFSHDLELLSYPHIYTDLEKKLKNLQNSIKIPLTLQQEVEEIETEFSNVYKLNLPDQLTKFSELNNTENPNFDASTITIYPRARYLLERYDELIKQQKNLAQQNEIETTFKHSFFHQLRVKFKAYFNIFKKLVDGTDDGYAAFRNFSFVRDSVSKDVLNLLTPILVGTVGIIINSAEAILGGRRAYKAYLDPRPDRQRQTRIGTGITASILGATGTGLAGILIFAGITGATLGGLAPLLPFLVPCFPFLIYAIELGRKWYILNQATKRENTAKQLYDDYVTKNQDELSNQNAIIRLKEAKLTELQQSIDEARNEQKLFHPILLKIKKGEILSAAEKNDYIKYLKISSEIKLIEHQYNSKITELNALKFVDPIKTALAFQQQYKDCLNLRLKAERKVAMNSIESIATGLVVTGVALGTSALFGVASVASFGFLPLALILTGIVMGFTLKAFGRMDDAYDNKITQGIRDGVTNTTSRITHSIKNLFSLLIMKCFTPPTEPRAEKKEAINTTNAALPTLPSSTHEINSNLIKRNNTSQQTITPPATESTAGKKEAINTTNAALPTLPNSTHEINSNLTNTTNNTSKDKNPPPIINGGFQHDRPIKSFSVLFSHPRRLTKSTSSISLSIPETRKPISRSQSLSNLKI